VSANQIEGKMKLDNGEIKPFRTIRVDPELSTNVRKYPVVFKGRWNPPFLRELLSWAFSILLFVGVWYLMIKRFDTRQAGFLQLGKSKARVYMQMN